MDEQINLKQIGSRIRAARSSKGMSQADLAVKASVSLPLISNIELGKTRMHLDSASGVYRSFAACRCAGSQNYLSE